MLLLVLLLFIFAENWQIHGLLLGVASASLV